MQSGQDFTEKNIIDSMVGWLVGWFLFRQISSNFSTILMLDLLLYCNCYSYIYLPLYLSLSSGSACLGLI